MKDKLSLFAYTDEPLEIALGAISSGIVSANAPQDAAAVRRRALGR
jgi:hypothetical protein